jgi:hypothetical protein
MIRQAEARPIGGICGQDHGKLAVCASVYSLLTPTPQDAAFLGRRFLDLAPAAVVEVTSEDKIIRWSLHWSQERCGVGERIVRELKPSA